MNHETFYKLADLYKEALKLTKLSPLTPCQITGEPGIALADGAQTINMCLGSRMWDEFDRRMRDTVELSDTNDAMEALNRHFDTHGDSIFGEYDLQEERLNLIEQEAMAKVETGRAALRVLRELEDEFGSSSVSPQESGD